MIPPSLFCVSLDGILLPIFPLGAYIYPPLRPLVACYTIRQLCATGALLIVLIADKGGAGWLFLRPQLDYLDITLEIKTIREKENRSL
jgi:hypothetical protein